MTRFAPATYPLTVYFDATCPLCTAEMGAMQARDSAKRLRLVDCSPISAVHSGQVASK